MGGQEGEEKKRGEGQTSVWRMRRKCRGRGT